MTPEESYAALEEAVSEHFAYAHEGAIMTQFMVVATGRDLNFRSVYMTQETEGAPVHELMGLNAMQSIYLNDAYQQVPVDEDEDTEGYS